MTVAVEAEIMALMLCLQRQRNHVLDAVEGLNDEALRRPVTVDGREIRCAVSVGPNQLR